MGAAAPPSGTRHVLAARRTGDAAMASALPPHHTRVAGDDRSPELLVVAHAFDPRATGAAPVIMRE
jgi:hypothetical protein